MLHHPPLFHPPKRSEGGAKPEGGGLPNNNGTEIYVLGTSFNTNAYESSKITLLEGSIKINSTILKPGQQLYSDKIINADIDRVMAWKSGDFRFNGNTIERDNG